MEIVNLHFTPINLRANENDWMQLEPFTTMGNIEDSPTVWYIIPAGMVGIVTQLCGDLPCFCPGPEDWQEGGQVPLESEFLYPANKKALGK